MNHLLVPHAREEFGEGVPAVVRIQGKGLEHGTVGVDGHGDFRRTDAVMVFLIFPLLLHEDSDGVGDMGVFDFKFAQYFTQCRVAC